METSPDPIGKWFKIKHIDLSRGLGDDLAHYEFAARAVLESTWATPGQRKIANLLRSYVKWIRLARGGVIALDESVEMARLGVLWERMGWAPTCADPPLTGSAAVCAEFIRAHPGCDGAAAARDAGITSGSFRKHVVPELKARGFIKPPGCKGYYPPKF